MNALAKVIKDRGLENVAAALGVSPQTLSNWRSRGVPVERCADVELVTGVTRQQLRPADFHRIWPELSPPASDAA